MKKFNTLFSKRLLRNILLFCILTFSITTITLARFVTKTYGYSEARVALFGNNASVEVPNIKGKPGDTTIIPIKITNALDGKTCEVAESFTIYINRIYGSNLPLNINLYKDKACTTLIYLDENNNYFDDDFKFSPTKKETKTYYLKIEWPESSNDVANAFEIDYLSLYFRVTQID